jgi:hypothetical protein
VVADWEFAQAERVKKATVKKTRDHLETLKTEAVPEGPYCATVFFSKLLPDFLAINRLISRHMNIS